MKIVILGSNGQLGKTLYKVLKSKFEIFAFDKLELDITSKIKLNLLYKIQPNIVINCAAYTNVANCEIDKKIAYKINTYSVKNISLICKDLNSLLIHFSTDYVFDGLKKSEYKEYDITNPLNEYGKSKLKAEIEIQNSKCNFLILRVSWLFSEYGNNFFLKIYEKIKNNEDLVIVDDQFGRPTYALDLGKSVKKIILNLTLNNKLNKVYHYSGGKASSWFEFSKFIKNYLEDNKTLISPISSKDYVSNVNRPARSILCSKLIKKDFDISPGNWQLGVKKIIKNLELNEK